MRVYKFSLAVSASVAMLLATASSVQAQTQPPTFNFEDLKNLVTTRDLRSVEQVVPLLPEELRENFVLMSRSRSLQSGTPDEPRAILFNRDASLVMSFTEDPARRGPERFEILTFDEKTARFSPKAIVFPDANSPASTVESPTNCFGCHGRIDDDLHPVWDPGLVWRGAYGSHDDQFGSQAEADAYARFVTGAARRGAYRSLNWSIKIGQGPRTQIENRPNLRLGLLMMRQQAKRIARQLETGSAETYKLRLKRLAGCDVHEPSKKLKDVVESALARFLTPLFGSAFVQTFLNDEAPSIEEVFEVVNDASLDVDEVPLTIEKRSFAVFDGSFGFRDLLIAEMAKRLGVRDLEFRSLTESPLELKASKGSKEIDELGAPLTPNARTRLCHL